MKEQLADFYGNYTSEEETAEEIRNLYEKTGYIIDTHTAVATGVYLSLIHIFLMIYDNSRESE